MDRVLYYIRSYKIPVALAFVAFFLLATSLVMRVVPSQQESVSFITKEASNSSFLSNNIHIDIEGAIENPGLYVLPEGSRVNDLIQLAGGFTMVADRTWVSKYLNKAQVLSDGDKLYIPAEGESENNSSASQTEFTLGSSVININIASSDELESLPGIGDKTAQKIIEGRPYSSREELREKKIVGNAVYEKIVDLITTL